MSAETKGSAVFGERLAFRAFVAYLALAYPLIVFHFGRNEWFVIDDWNLLLPSVTPNPFAPVEQHWSTIPILIYRAYFHSFGANYFPFLATVSALHLTSVALLRSVMRRAGASAWAATIGAALLVLFGRGFMSMVFAIQITQNLSIVLGLTQMILADHDGPMDRRDWAGLLAGTLSLMCSGLAPILVIGVGLAAFARRGLGAAAFHTVPLGALYLVWWHEHPSLQNTDMYRGAYSESHPFRVLGRGLWASAEALGHFDAAAIALAALLAIGLYLSLASRKWVLRRSGIAMPLALLACAVIYFVVLGLQRSRMVDAYVVLFSHHLYTAACFSLPALVSAAEAIARRVPRTAPILSAFGLSLVPLNAWGFGSDDFRDTPNKVTTARLAKQTILSIAHSPYASSAAHVDATRWVSWTYAPGLTVGWLLEQARLGRIPAPGPVDAGVREYVKLFYGLTDRGFPFGAECTDAFVSLDVRPHVGERIAVGSAVLVSSLDGDDAESGIAFTWPDTSAGHALQVELPDLHLRLTPVSGLRSFPYCSGSPPPTASVKAAPPLVDATHKTIAEDPVAREKLKKAIQSDPAAMEALRKAIQSDPAAMEALKKAMAGH